MPVKPQATAKVYYSLVELKRNESCSLKTLIPAFPYKNRSRPFKPGGIHHLSFSLPPKENCYIHINFSRMDTQPESQIVSEIFDNHNEVQREVMELKFAKTRNKLFTIAVVIFLFDLLALLAANLVTSEALLIILVIP
jgi:hypothetical protein